MKVFIGNYTDDGSPRQEDVFLDKWDSFNADHTIALIVAPLLQQLKLTKHGSGMVVVVVVVVGGGGHVPLQ